MSVFDRRPSLPNTFAEALMPGLTLQDLPAEFQVDSPSSQALTEKGVVLESFTRYVEENLETQPKLEFPGGEVLPKEVPQSGLVLQFEGRDQWEKTQKAQWGNALWDAVTGNKSRDLQVVFVSESLQLPSEATGPADLEFLSSFSPPVAELFQKMVVAMKLPKANYRMTGLKVSGVVRTDQELLEEIHWLSPQFVVPLGAQATQVFLGNRERLASAHGKFFPLPILSQFTGKVVPLFHPSIIASNLNMKKSTWADMQKLMQSLGIT